MPTLYGFDTQGNVITRDARLGPLPVTMMQVDEKGAANWMTQLMINLPNPPADHSVMAYLFKEAQTHSTVTGDPEREVGDLQTLLGAAWEIMTPHQRTRFLRYKAVQDMEHIDKNHLLQLVRRTDAAYYEQVGISN